MPCRVADGDGFGRLARRDDIRVDSTGDSANDFGGWIEVECGDVFIADEDDVSVFNEGLERLVGGGQGSRA